MFLPTDTVRRDEIISDMTKLPSAIAAPTPRAVAQFDGIRVARRQGALLLIGSAVPTDEPTDLRAACPTITIGQTVSSGHFNQFEVPDQVNLMPLALLRFWDGLSPEGAQIVSMNDACQRHNSGEM
jgi:hypothetical protein